MMMLTGLITAMMFLFQITEIQTSQKIDSGTRIRVSVRSNATQNQTQTLANQIAATPNVKQIKYSTKEQELKKLVREQGDEFKVDPDLGSTPTLAVFYVSLNDTSKLKDTTESLKQLPYVDHVNGNIKNNEQTQRALRLALYFVLGIESIFLLITFAIIKHAAKMNIALQRNIIDKQLEVGATHKYIKTPFVYQGAFNGLFGSLISLVLIIPSYIMMYLYLNGRADGTITLMQPIKAIPIAWLLTVLVLTLFGALSVKLSIHIKEKQQVNNF